MNDPRARSADFDVFRYLDYRLLLADAYAMQKGRGLSYRAFSKRAGLGAPNYLKLVIDGQRNLTNDMAPRFARALGLKGEQSDYFCTLVAFNQASTVHDKNAAHQRLLGYLRYRALHKLDASYAAYHSTWYLPAIRELVGSEGFVEDAATLAGRMLPPITAREAKEALATLLELGLIARDETGGLRQTSSIVSTGAETAGMYIANYHAQMMQCASASMDLVRPEARDISSLTVCVSAPGLKRLKARLQEMRRELLELAESGPGRSQVVQLNFQLFPLSEAVSGESVAKRPLKPAAKKTSKKERS